MEPVRGGALANVPPKAERLFRDFHPELSAASWAVRYAASLDGVIGVLSGMSDMEQLLDNTGYMRDFKPLTDDERAVVAKAVAVIRENTAIPCTGCNYCVGDCPKDIAIPGYFALYNSMKASIPAPFHVESVYYNRYLEKHGRASDCIKCRQCEKHCPQHIGVVNYLKDVSKAFDRQQGA
jgi:predicted aldo/keto reductase-like oxidoreductase